MSKYRIVRGKYYDRETGITYAPRTEHSVKEWVYLPETFADCWELLDGEESSKESIIKKQNEKIAKETKPAVKLLVVESEREEGMYDVLNETSKEFVNDAPLSADDAAVLGGIEIEDIPVSKKELGPKKKATKKKAAKKKVAKKKVRK